MRDILFRGKRVDEYGNAEWHYGDLAQFKEADTATVNCVRVIPSTVGQFTGLTDKNGKRIFEGDIIKTDNGRACLVVWRSTGYHCGFDLRPIEAINPPPSEWLLWYGECIDVIGNVHDDPGLMEGSVQ